MTIYLTVEQVLFIHMRLVAETGGSAGVRDLDLLASAVGRPQASFSGQDLYPDIYYKAAALLNSLVRNHPFVDGNKRVGITAAGIFLLRNGLRPTASHAELEQFTLQVARSETSTEQIVAWLKRYTASVS